MENEVLLKILFYLNQENRVNHCLMLLIAVLIPVIPLVLPFVSSSLKNCHIITIEDPIEYLHRHDKSIVNQREVGIDTDDYSIALLSALRECSIRIRFCSHKSLGFVSTFSICSRILRRDSFISCVIME